MKPLSADGSVGPPHVRVGHCQASIQSGCTSIQGERPKPQSGSRLGFFIAWKINRENAGQPSLPSIARSAVLEKFDVPVTCQRHVRLSKLSIMQRSDLDGAREFATRANAELPALINLVVGRSSGQLSS